MSDESAPRGLRPLDPETDKKVWALAERISELPTSEQPYATTVAITALLAEQSDDTIQSIFKAARTLMESYRASAGFKAKRS